MKDFLLMALLIGVGLIAGAQISKVIRDQGVAI
jgi:hypothetical protein